MAEPLAFQVTAHGGIDPDTESPRFVAKHLSAYKFAAPFATGRTLEIGFGDGYGSSLLARSSEEVIGVDLFEDNVQKAQAKHGGRNLKFLRMNATDLEGLAGGYFDLVVSFQVIEHIPQGRLGRYLEEIKRVLKKDGVACISTLNLARAMKKGQPYPKSPHHDKEFRPEELRALLSAHFENVKLYGLYPTAKHLFFEKIKKTGLTRALPEAWDPVQAFYRGIATRDFYWQARKDLDGSIDLLGVCRN